MKDSTKHIALEKIKRLNFERFYYRLKEHSEARSLFAGQPSNPYKSTLDTLLRLIVDLHEIEEISNKVIKYRNYRNYRRWAVTFIFDKTRLGNFGFFVMFYDDQAQATARCLLRTKGPSCEAILFVKKLADELLELALIIENERKLP
jgi:hypothetical protein